MHSSGESEKKGTETAKSEAEAAPKERQEESDDDPNEKDAYGATKALRKQISKKYKMIEVLGKGSYGCVSKARCLRTGRIVACKIMENQTNTEYDTIKLLREIQILRSLQKLCAKLTK